MELTDHKNLISKIQLLNECKKNKIITEYQYKLLFNIYKNKTNNFRSKL